MLRVLYAFSSMIIVKCEKIKDLKMEFIIKKEIKHKHLKNSQCCIKNEFKYGQMTLHKNTCEARRKPDAII